MTARPRSADDCRAAEERGEPPSYLMFWNPDPSVAAGRLSQWWPAPFTVDGMRYPTAEHAMMAGKARLFGDDDALARVLGSDDPAEAKAAGRAVRGYDTSTWSAHRYDVVVAANVAKFGQDPDLRRYLDSTGDTVLVEASPEDRIWGIGLAADDERAASAARWPGLNLLGFALMDARDALR